MKTNFDTHLDQQMADPSSARRLHRAGKAWDVALQRFGKGARCVHTRTAKRPSGKTEA